MSAEVITSLMGGSILSLFLLGVVFLIIWFFNVVCRPKIEPERTPPEYAKKLTVNESPILFIRDNMALRKYCFNQTNNRLTIDERLADAEKIYNYLSKHTEPWQEQRK